MAKVDMRELPSKPMPKQTYWLHDPMKLLALVAKCFRFPDMLRELEWATEFVDSGKITAGVIAPQVICQEALSDDIQRAALSTYPSITHVLWFLVPGVEFVVNAKGREGSEFAIFVGGKSGAGFATGSVVLASTWSGWKPEETKESPFVGSVFYYRRK